MPLGYSAIGKAVLFTAMACFVSTATAGGLIGDLINTVAPGVGTRLDDAHREIKEAIPPYKAIEEGASQLVNETLVQSGAPILQELIARSRDDALNNGVEPVPPEIRNNLVGFIPDHILDAARFRVQGGGDLTLQVNSIRYGEAQAITLDYVIVFKDQNDALYNPTLWVHELTHVGQYQQWGLHDFALRYLRSHESVEREAYEAETRYLAWAAIRNSNEFSSTGQTTEFMVNRPVANFSASGSSSVCHTWIGPCQVNGSAPVGTPCWCDTTQGPITGALVPLAIVPTRAAAGAGFPPGFGMQVCGCWGPTPASTAPEPRCANQMVRINICPAMCAPGHPAYAYVCM
ncbi:DUF4157 domain-containing protein [Mesorhizobium sp. M0045]|uniref:eCIS core domain-containing protein n=1 Tax=Mesorhizobium sp. M0045 TaxID=2956857 RepID=UPI003339336B